MSKKISELNIRETLTGNELIPFAENEENGAFKSGVLIDEMHSILTDIEDSEQGRVLAEQGRVNAESARASAETQRASEWLTLKGEAETATEHAEAAAQSVEAVTDRIDALEQGKADKDGSYDAMTVGLAKGLLPSSGVENEASWTERFTAANGAYSGGDHNVEDGLAALRSIKGFTVKNLVQNGNFERGFEGWENRFSTEVGDMAIDLGSTIKIMLTDGNLGVCQHISLVKNHKYLLSYRCRGLVMGGARKPFNQFYSRALGHFAFLTDFIDDTQWSITNVIYTHAQDSDDCYLRGSASAEHPTNCLLDKSYGVRIYDLTEMGIANLYTGTDAAERYTELFDRYTEGVEGASTEAIHTTGANAFDVSMRIVGKAIGEDGAIVDDESKALLQVPVLKSKTGVGCNNGYRIHGIVAERIGWNPFAIDDSRFDCAYDVTEPNADDADYSANDKGYLFIQVDASASVDNVVVHPRWSYSEQFDAEWYAQHQDERMGSLPVPQSYIDAEGHVQPIGALHGLTDGTTWWRDEIDLAKGKYIKRVRMVRTSDFRSNVSVYDLDKHIFFIRLSNALPSFANLWLSTEHFYTIYSTGGIPNKHCSMSRFAYYFRDESFETLQQAQAYVDNLVASGRFRAYYVLATPEVYDLAEDDYHVEYPICDFGTERVEGEGATPQLTTAYLPNYTDVIRNAASKGEVASLTERVQALEQLIAPLATSNLNDTTDELAD